MEETQQRQNFNFYRLIQSFWRVFRECWYFISNLKKCSKYRMSVRPVREKRQPRRNVDKVELNLDLIEKMESNKRKGIHKEQGASCAKLLSIFINAANRRLIDHQMQMVDEREASEVKKESLGKKEPKNTVQPQFGASRMKASKPASDFRGGKVPSYSRPEEKPQKTTNPKKLQIKRQPETSSKTKRSETMFNRAAYHVAIAYTIFLSRLKEKNIQILNQNQLDPTYPAWKLRLEQMDP